MKALSLWQPWASLLAIGVKPYETRDWAPPAWLIGHRIAIHATKKAVSRKDRAWAVRHRVDDLPLGAIVCTASLAGAYRCGQVVRCYPRSFVSIVGAIRGSRGGISIVLDEFGDYSAGRWAWLLTDVEPSSPAIPARGARGLWAWNGDAASEGAATEYGGSANIPQKACVASRTDDAGMAR